VPLSLSPSSIIWYRPVGGYVGGWGGYH